MPLLRTLHIRASFTDQGQIPRIGAGLGSAPDILPSGTQPVADPAEAFLGANFDRDCAKGLVPGAENYIYVRGENLGELDQDGQVFSYFAPSTLLLYPSVWRGNPLSTASGADHVKVSGQAGQPFVTSEALLFKAVPPNEDFGIVSRVVTARDPNPIPDFTGIFELAQWLTETDGISFRRIRVIDPARPEIFFSASYCHGNQEASVVFVLEAIGAPVGSEVWLAAVDPLPDGSTIAIPPSKITSAAGMKFAASVLIPSNWATKINAGYWSNGGAPASGFGLSLRVELLVDGEGPGPLKEGQSLDSTPPERACEGRSKERLSRAAPEGNVEALKKAILVGSINYRS